MLITENCSSKFTIMSFGAPALKFSDENGISKKSLFTSLEIGGNNYAKQNEQRVTNAHPTVEHNLNGLYIYIQVR